MSRRIDIPQRIVQDSGIAVERLRVLWCHRGARRRRRPAWRRTSRLVDGKPACAGFPNHARMAIGNQCVERRVNILIPSILSPLLCRLLQRLHCPLELVVQVIQGFTGGIERNRDRRSVGLVNLQRDE